MKSSCARFAVVAVCLSLWICAASVTQADASSTNGTDLTTTASVASTICSADAESATVNINVVIDSTASAAPASVLISTNGGATFIPEGTISDWSHSGRDKSADLALAETFPANTTTQFEVCAAQPGSTGNSNKSSCADLSIDPACVLQPSYIPAATLDYTKQSHPALGDSSHTVNGADFLVIGDWGNQADITDVQNVANVMDTWASNSNSNFVNSLGSNFYEGGTFDYEGVLSTDDPKFDTLWKNVYSGAALSKLPWWLLMGAHDWYQGAAALLCTTGQQLVNGACTPPPCTPQQVLQNGVCVAACPNGGEALINSSCVAVVGSPAYEMHHQDPNWNIPDYFHVQRFALPDSKHATVIYIEDDLLFYGYPGKKMMAANFQASGWTPAAHTIEKQLAWIDKALETANGDDYVLVLGNHPVFTCASEADTRADVALVAQDLAHGDDPGVMSVGALINKWQPTAYLNAHHSTLAYYLTNSTLQNSTLQIQVGSGGNLDPTCAPLAGATAGAELANTYGFAHAQLTGSEFAIEFVTEAGASWMQTSIPPRTPLVGVQANTTWLPPVGDPSIHAQ